MVQPERPRHGEIRDFCVRNATLETADTAHTGNAVVTTRNVRFKGWLVENPVFTVQRRDQYLVVRAVGTCSMVIGRELLQKLFEFLVVHIT